MGLHFRDDLFERNIGPRGVLNANFKWVKSVRKKFRLLTMDKKMLLFVMLVMGILSVLRAAHAWVTGFLVTDEFLYISSALHSTVYSDRYFFGYFNILFFRLLGIDGITRFVYFLPLYLYLWSSMVILSFYGIMKTLEFDARTIALSLFSSLFLVGFILLTLGFLTEAVGLGLAMAGIFFLVKSVKNRGNRTLVLSSPFFAALALAGAAYAREPYTILSLGSAFVVAFGSLRILLMQRVTKRTLCIFILAILLFASPTLFFLNYPQDRYSRYVSPYVTNFVSILLLPVTTTNIVNTSSSSYGSTSSAKTSATSTTSTTSAPSTSSSATFSTSTPSIGPPFQRKTFFAAARYWVFFSDRKDLVYSTSTDGNTWSGSRALRPATEGDSFSTYYDGKYFYYAYADCILGDPLLFRRYSPSSDGSLTPSVNEQTAVDGAPGKRYCTPSVASDSNGNPWVTYSYYDGTNYDGYIDKSSATDGTWKDSTGFPKSLFSTVYEFTAIVPLTDGKIAAVYCANGGGLRLSVQSWNGSVFNSSVFSSTNCEGQYFSAVNQGDDVHIAFLDGGLNIEYVKYTYSGNKMGSQLTIQRAVTPTSAPTLTIDKSSNDLYVFWAGSPSGNHIYYSHSTNGTSWDIATDWITETAVAANDGVAASYQASGGSVGVEYVTVASSPFVKFVTLAVTSASTSSTSTTSTNSTSSMPTSIPPTSATTTTTSTTSTSVSTTFIHSQTASSTIQNSTPTNSIMRSTTGRAPNSSSQSTTSTSLQIGLNIITSNSTNYLPLGAYVIGPTGQVETVVRQPTPTSSSYILSYTGAAGPSPFPLASQAQISSATSGGSFSSVVGRQFTNTAKIFLGGLLLGWGPLSFLFGAVGVFALFFNSSKRDSLSLLLLMISLLALSSYLAVSFALSTDQSYLTFEHYSTIIRFSSTAAPAYFLAAPFAFSFLLGRRKEYFKYVLAAFLIFAIAVVPVYQTYAASSLTERLVGNPLTLSYRTTGVQIRDYVVSHSNEGPFRVIGFPEVDWYWTPGANQLNSVQLFPYLPESDFIKHRWTTFYIWGNNLSDLATQAPYLLPIVELGKQGMNDTAPVPYVVLSRQLILNNSAGDFKSFFVRVQLSWNASSLSL